jgi:hypothetical protein
VPIDTLFPAGSPLNRTRDPNPFVVQAQDAFGTPISGVAVQWRVSDGGGTMFAFTTFTDAFGFAGSAAAGVPIGTLSPANAARNIGAFPASIQFMFPLVTLSVG